MSDSHSAIEPFTPALSTTPAYGLGDVVAQAMSLDTSNPGNPAPYGDSAVTLTDILVLDTDNIGMGIRFYFFSEAVTVPANNAAFAISAADMRKCIGWLDVDAALYITVDTKKWAQLPNLSFTIPPVCYVVPVALSAASGVMTASGLTFVFKAIDG